MRHMAERQGKLGAGNGGVTDGIVRNVAKVVAYCLSFAARRAASCRLAKLIARDVNYRETSTLLGHRLKICLNKHLNRCLACVDLHANG